MSVPAALRWGQGRGAVIGRKDKGREEGKNIREGGRREEGGRRI